MANNFRMRRSVFGFMFLLAIFIIVAINSPEPLTKNPIAADVSEVVTVKTDKSPAIKALRSLAVKGRAPKTDYSRQQFGSGWETTNGCDTRNIILNRDMPDAIVDKNCNVTSGTLNDPYTGKVISFSRGSLTSAEVQIDHVVALSDAWQKGAQGLSLQQRTQLANDPLELLAVDGPANQQKSDGDAATWLPSNKPFRCEYVARQVAVKAKYSLWLTQAEHDAILKILSGCAGQALPSID